MADTPIEAPASTTFIFVDRRRTGRGKSLNNRQKLLKRVKDSIKNAKPEDIDAGGVGKAATPQGGNAYNNPIKVARSALSEPTFHYDPDMGEREIVLIGNDQWLKGDEFPMQKGGGGSGGAGPGEEGEDDFIINISRSEFFDVFFEDCELPDLKETHEKEMPEYKMQRAGFQKVGHPGQLAVIRSFKHSKARRLALSRGARDELKELEDELEALMHPDHEHETGVNEWAIRCEFLTQRIEEIKRGIAAKGVFEDVDLRYRKSEKIQVKASDAVLIMVMDVSGSMDEEKKRMARKFFSLQYAFIKRKYPQTDLIFIAHTDTPHEMTEEEFFTSRLSGGTVVSPAWTMAHDIIKARYDSTQTNIYLSYAGDGDNWDSDNADVIEEIETKGLLSKLRHAVYVQVGLSFAASYGGGIGLWQVMQSIAQTGSKKLACIKIADDSEVFDAFKNIYGKKKVKK